MFPIFWYVGHIFIVIGDHPDELGNRVIEVFGRVGTPDVVFLSVRFSRFY